MCASNQLQPSIECMFYMPLDSTESTPTMMFSFCDSFSNMFAAVFGRLSGLDVKSMTKNLSRKVQTRILVWQCIHMLLLLLHQFDLMRLIAARHLHMIFYRPTRSFTLVVDIRSLMCLCLLRFPRRRMQSKFDLHHKGILTKCLMHFRCFAFRFQADMPGHFVRSSFPPFPAL